MRHFIEAALRKETHLREVVSARVCAEMWRFREEQQHQARVLRDELLRLVEGHLQMMRAPDVEHSRLKEHAARGDQTTEAVAARLEGRIDSLTASLDEVRAVAASGAEAVQRIKDLELSVGEGADMGQPFGFKPPLSLLLCRRARVLTVCAPGQGVRRREMANLCARPAYARRCG